MPVKMFLPSHSLQKGMVHQIAAKQIWQQFAVELQKQKFQIDVKVENDVAWPKIDSDNNQTC